jgi:glycogen operon protein
MHVDGFRFDLASVFNRNVDGSISFEEPAVLGMIISDPDLATARFIAEPWDAAGAFHLGKKFPGIKWLQWNSAFRDDVRRFVKSDLGMVKTFLNRVYGSDDIFPDDLAHAFHAYQSINYVTSHDGFTLYDLVSYNNKHNEANGEDSADGMEINHSWNCGTEGDENLSEELRTFRKRQAKNLCSVLFLSNGTPMFVAGDEFLRTQKGNNNPYNQDNEISWVDWSLKEKHQDFFSFFKNMIAFRKEHRSLSRSRFWRQDVEYFTPHGNSCHINELPLTAFYLDGSSEDDDDIYVMFNAHWDDHWFFFQKTGPWMRRINTALAHPDDFVEEGKELVGDRKYLVLARSIAVFTKRKLIAPSPS